MVRDESVNVGPDLVTDALTTDFGLFSRSGHEIRNLNDSASSAAILSVCSCVHAADGLCPLDVAH